MTATILDPGYFDDVAPLDANTVDLLDEATVQAVQLSQDWESLLKALAIAGFEQWLAEGAASLTATRTAVNLGRAGDVMVGNYRLGVLAMGGSGAAQVEICLDESADTWEDAIAHLYVLVEVREEVNQVSILAGLRPEQLLQRVGIERLRQAHASGEPLYIPVSHFEVEPEQILLYLSCLEPAEATVREASVEAIQTNLLSETATEIISSISDSLLASVINASSWVQDQLDVVTERLEWTLLPPLSSAMRSVRGTVDTVLETLASRGISLPDAARGAGGPIRVGTYIYQTYAWAWPVETEGEIEWSLFLLLGPQVGEILPEGTQLRVSDRTEVLALEVLSQSSTDAYLYTQVQGSQQEQFRVSIILPDGMEITLPTFEFESDG